MGEVYRAEHVRLRRDVAVNVRHELTSDNPEYKSRFEREARVLASLNHPNIATLHGLEEVGESTLREMELVPGETLTERISRGPMAASDTLPIFKQIALAHLTQLYMRPLDRFESTTVAGTEGAIAPFVSPDGRWIECRTVHPFRHGSVGTVEVVGWVAAWDDAVIDGSNPHVPMSWSPDGANLAFDERKPSAERDIWILPRGGDPFPFLVTPFDESSPAFSPTDGRWLAYVSDESGRSEVYVQPFPGPGAKWLISIDGGTEPAWSPDGKELFLRRGDALMSAAVTTTGDFTSERPKVVFDGRYATVDGVRNYDVAPDKPGFVVGRSDGNGEGAQFNVVLNWFSELRGRR